MAKKNEQPNSGQSIEEILEEGEVLKAQATIEDEEAQKKQEDEQAIPEVEIDLDEERERTKKEVTDSITTEVVEPLRRQILDLQETLSPTEKDDYDVFVDQYEKEHGEAPQWKQVALFLEDRAVKRLKDEQKTQEEERKQAEEVSAKQQEDQANENFKVWQGQLQELEDRGDLPKMEKPEQGDPGFDARVKLYGFMQATWKSQNPSTNLWEVYAKHWKNESGQPAGADAPISFGNGGTGGDDDRNYSYSEVHKGAQDIEGLVIRELQKAARNS